MRRQTSGTTILHSGTLTKDRPLAPLLRVLKPPLRLALHGYVAPDILAEVDARAATSSSFPRRAGATPSSGSPTSDVTLVTQARGAGDETAVAAKVYEYLALGKPVLCHLARRRNGGAAPPPRR